MESPEIMTIEEVAEYLRVSEKTVYDWAQKGQIPCGKLGNSWRFIRSEIERWVSSKLKKGNSQLDVSPIVLGRVLTPERILFLETELKSEALLCLINCLAQAPQIKDHDELARAIFQRENLMSTGIGLGIAVPHVRLTSINDIVMAVGIARDGIKDYESLDGEPVRLIFMVAAGGDQHTAYLALLSTISSRLKDEAFRHQFVQAEDTVSFYKLLVSE